jgi:uncharacterized repeat protein (TIGR02543 family)
MRCIILTLLVFSSYSLLSMGAVSGGWTYIVENGGATITASTATGAVTIPSELGGYPVLKVGNGYPPVFGPSNTSVTSVVIPSSVTSIGMLAFYGCNSLPSITIPDSVTSIGSGAFGYCRSLVSITIGNGVASIGNAAFNDCINLTTITIGNNVTSIGSQAFSGCSSLTSLTVPASVTSIGNYAFEYCTRLTTVYLPAHFQQTYQNFSLAASQVNFGFTLATSCEPTEGTLLIDPIKSTYQIGDTVTIIATPKAGYLFVTWSGASTSTTSSITLAIDADKTVTANFVQDTRDNDTDGLTNFQEYITYGTNPNQKDTNSDGVEDGVAVSLGYSPTFNFSALTTHLQNNPPTGLYTAAQYSDNYTAGQQSVISNPNIYNLFTITQYNDHLTTGFNAGREHGKTDGRAEVTANPYLYNLYTATQYNDNYNTGRQSILTDPNAYQLYTTSQIQNMAVGDLVLTKNGDETFTLNYDIEQSTDLQNWTPYQALSLPLTGLPTDKAFVRIKAKQQ